MVIFYVHRGRQEYLLASIKQIEKRIKNAEIILLGDESNVDIEGIKGEIIDKYSEMANKFKLIYKHFSTNGYDYELFCLQRWFYICEYMKRKQIEYAMYIDSDVLLNDIPDNLDKSQYYYCFNSGHTSIFSYTTIKQLCDFIMECYSSDEKLFWLKSILERRQEEGLPGGVSDMTMILSYAYYNSEKVTDLSQVYKLKVYDHNIQESDDFEIYKGCKAIYYIKGIYYFKENLTGILIEAASMHFQGDAKVYMPFIIEPPKIKGEFLFDYEKRQWIDYEKRDRCYSKSKSMKIKEMIYKVLKKVEMMKAFKK